MIGSISFLCSTLNSFAKIHFSWTWRKTLMSRGLGFVCEEISWESTILLHPVVGDVLMDVCLLGIIKDYSIYLENLSFLFFFFIFRLMEISRCTNESVTETSRSISLIWSAPKKRPMIESFEKNRKAKAPGQRRCPLVRRRQDGILSYHPSYAGRRKPQLSPIGGLKIMSSIY